MKWDKSTKWLEKKSNCRLNIQTNMLLGLYCIDLNLRQRSAQPMMVFTIVAFTGHMIKIVHIPYICKVILSSQCCICAVTRVKLSLEE